MTKSKKIPRKISKTLKKYRKENKYLCMAPFVSMSIGMNGYVSPCCYTEVYQNRYFEIERYPDVSFPEIRPFKIRVNKPDRAR